MKRWLKKQFVPHEINGFRPLFLRKESAIKLAGILVVLELILFVLPTLYFPQYAKDLNLTSVLPVVLSTLTNEERQKNNLPPLIVNPLLTQAAQRKAEDMATKSYFAHNSPEGRTPWYWINLVGYSYAYAGENLAVNFSDSEEVTEAWMKSPTHQANIVGRSYTEMGTGIASGMYKGRETVFVVQIYGTPIVKVASETQINPISSPSLRGLRRNSDLSMSPSPNNPEPAQILGESSPEVTPVESPSFLDKLMSSPKGSTNAVLYLALAVVLIALFLNIAIKFEYQYPDLLANGAVVALLIIGFHLGNNFIAAQTFETSFTEFSPPADEITIR